MKNPKAVAAPPASRIASSVLPKTDILLVFLRGSPLHGQCRELVRGRRVAPAGRWLPGSGPTASSIGADVKREMAGSRTALVPGRRPVDVASGGPLHSAAQHESFDSREAHRRSVRARLATVPDP